MGLNNKPKTKAQAAKSAPHPPKGTEKAKSEAKLEAKPKGKGKAKAVEPIPATLAHSAAVSSDADEDADDDDEAQWSDEDSDNSEDSDDEGVDEEGMARLMLALGDDGLDEFGQAQLDALREEDEGSELDSDEEEEGSGSALDEDEEVEVDGSEDDAEDAEDDDAIPLDEVSSVDEDAVLRQKIEIDNKAALDQIRESIQLDPSFPWTETLVLSYPHKIEADVDDDLNRELAFYKQALHSANTARSLATSHNLPFTRPSDYFAEMIKSDAHMERIRIRLLDESSGIKKSEDKRKEREGKKFGKQVQVEKIKEREKSKKEMDERLKALKRKRKDVLDNPRDKDEDFDVAVEDAISDRPAKRGKASNGRGVPRSVRDKKYGFGGAGRHAKQNTRESTDNFDAGKAGRSFRGGRGGRGGSGGRGGRGGRGGSGASRGRHSSKRPGKSKREASRGRA